MYRAPLFQYQRLAEPVLPPAANETVTLDKWFRQQPDPTRKVHRSHLVDDGTTVEPVTANETITLDKWFVNHPQPDRRPPVRRAQETQCGPLTPSLLVVPPYAWNRPTNYPRRPRKRRPEGQAVEPPAAALVAAPITVDEWYSEPAAVVRPRVRRPEGGAVAPPDLIDRAVPTDWMREPAVPVRRPVGVRPGTVEVDPVQVDVPQPAVPSDWMREADYQRRSSPRSPGLGAAQFGSFTAALVFPIPGEPPYGWRMDPDPLPNRVKPRLPGHFAYVYEPTLYEVPPLDWMQPFPQWLRPRTRLPAGVEGGAYQGVPIANPTVVFDWLMQHPQPDRLSVTIDSRAALAATSGPPPLIPTLPPPPVAPPLPGAGNSKPFVPRDPTLDRRDRMFQDVVSEVLNSLLGSGQLVQTAAKTYKLAGSEFVADRAPNAHDDETIGVRAGSRWIDTVAKTIWFNTSAAAGAAVWKGPF